MILGSNIRVYRTQQRLFFYGIMFVAIVLRFFKLYEYDLWHDEAYMLLRAEWLSKSELIRSFFVHLKWFPFLYETIVQFMVMCFQSSCEIALRAVSVVFSLGTLFVAYKFFDKFSYSSHTRDAQKIVFLMAISPLYIAYAQEISNYTLFQFLAVFSFYSLFMYIEWEKKGVWGYAYLLISIGLILSHYFGIYVIGIQLIVLSVVREYRGVIKKLMGAFVIIFLIEIFLLRGTRAIPEVLMWKYGWADPPDGMKIISAYINLLFGYNINKFFFWCGFLCATLLFISGSFVIAKTSKKNFQIVCVICLGAPLFLCALNYMSGYVVKINYFVPRYLSFITPFLYYVIVRGMYNGPKIILRILIGFFLISTLLSLFNYYNNVYPLPEKPYRVGVHPKQKIQKVLSFLSQNNSRNTVWFVYGNPVYPILMYYTKSFTNKVYFLNETYKFWGTSYVINDFYKNTPFDRVEVVDSYSAIPWGEQLLVFYSFWENEYVVKLKEMLEAFKKDYVMINNRQCDGVYVYLFEKKLKET